MAQTNNCPQCGYRLDHPEIRCPRCYKLLLVSCGGSCSKCPSKGGCCK